MFTEVNNKVSQFFFRNPAKTFHLREIARNIELSAAGTLKILRKLEEKHLVIRQKTRAVDNFKANLNNKEFQNLKYAYNICSLKYSGLIDFINEKYSFPEAIILFGSYAKGEDTETSDIDIAIITKKELSFDLSKFEKILERKIVIHEITLAKASREFINNLINGIVLSGYLKIK